MAKNNGQVQVARIAAWQAILVAIITAMSGAIAGYLARPSSSAVSATMPQPAALQRYLVVHGVDGQPGQMIRVVARINGLLYAYPADVTFTPVTTAMPEQKLPLPLMDLHYNVSFEAQIMGSTCRDVSYARSRATPQFNGSSLPTDLQTYQLLNVDRGGAYGAPSLTVRYSFR
jgi:hypothetical protein